VIIVIGVIVAAVTAGIGVTTVLTTYPHTALTKQCSATPTKMFDKESVPKYIIGPEYNVIPVNPITTEVMLTSCS
jgi:predicted CoA-binding protein